MTHSAVTSHVYTGLWTRSRMELQTKVVRYHNTTGTALIFAALPKAPARLLAQFLSTEVEAFGPFTGPHELVIPVFHQYPHPVRIPPDPVYREIHTRIQLAPTLSLASSWVIG